MDFEVCCECGEFVVVSEGAAGASLKCACGRRLVVPSLDELRAQAGLPPTLPSPELAIEYLLAAGLLAGAKSCVCCRADTREMIVVSAECERALTNHSGGRVWASFFGFWLTAILFPIAVWLREQRSEEVHGRDKFYRLPLPVCASCKPNVRGTTALKQYLRQIPEYRRLLDKFPDARVAVCKMMDTER
jgi:hypothetical protein